MLFQRLLGGVNDLLGLIAQVDQFAAGFVFRSVRLGILAHPLHFILAQTRRTLDLNLLGLARGLVGGADMQNAVGVDVELDFDLRHAPRRRWNIRQIKPAQRAIVRGKLALALQHVNRHTRLIIAGG